MRRPLALSGFAALIMQIILLRGGLSRKADVVCSIVLFTLSVISLCVYAAIKKHRKIILPVVSVLCTALAVCLIHTSAEKNVSERISPLIGQSATAECTITDFPEKSPYGSGFYCTVRADTINGTEAGFKIRLLMYSYPDADVYDKLTVKLSNIALPGGGSDESQMSFFSKGILLTCNVKEVQNITHTKNHGPGYYLLLIRKDIKTFLFTELDKNIASLCYALLTSDNSEMPRHLTNVFRYCGISHIVVVSGMHLAVWSYAVYAALRAMRMRSKAAVVLSSLAIIFIMAAVGFSPSVIRAAVMILVIRLGELFYKKADSLNSLGLAVLGFCFVNPYAAAGLSFLLSVLATLGIILFADYFSSIANRLTKNIKSRILRTPLRAVLTAFGISLSANLTILPVSCVLIGSSSVLSGLATTLVSLPAEISMIFSSLACIFKNAEVLYKPLLLIAGLSGKLVIKTAELLSQIPYCLIRTKSAILFTLFSALLISFTVFIKSGEKIQKYAKRVFIAVLAMSIISASVLTFADHSGLFVGYFESENGFCAVLRDGDEYALLSSGSSGYEIDKTLSDAACVRLDLWLSANTRRGTEKTISESYTPTLYAVADGSEYNFGKLKITSGDSYFLIKSGVRSLLIDLGGEIPQSIIKEADTLLCKKDSTIQYTKEFSDIIYTAGDLSGPHNFRLKGW